VSNLSINFEYIFSSAHGNFEEQNKVGISIIIINYCIGNINACYSYIINAWCKYCFFNKGLLEEWISNKMWQ